MQILEPGVLETIGNMDDHIVFTTLVEADKLISRHSYPGISKIILKRSIGYREGPGKFYWRCTTKYRYNGYRDSGFNIVFRIDDSYHLVVWSDITYREWARTGLAGEHRVIDLNDPYLDPDSYPGIIADRVDRMLCCVQAHLDNPVQYRRYCSVQVGTEAPGG